MNTPPAATMDTLPDELLLAVFGQNRARLPVCRRFRAVFDEYVAALEDIYTARISSDIINKITPGAKIGHSRACGRRGAKYSATYGWPAHSGDRVWYHWSHIYSELFIIMVRHKRRSSSCKVTIYRDFPRHTAAYINTRTFTGINDAVSRARGIQVLSDGVLLCGKSLASMLAEHPDKASLITYALCLSHTGDYLRVHAAARATERERVYATRGIRPCACSNGHVDHDYYGKCNNVVPFPPVPVARGDNVGARA